MTQLLLTIALDLHNKVRARFHDDIRKRGLEIPLAEKNFWSIQYQKKSLFKELVGHFDPLFLTNKVKYKTERQYSIENKKVITVNSQYLVNFLNYIDFPGNDPIQVLNNYLETVETEDREFQRRMLNIQVAVKKKSKPLEDIDQLLEDKAKLLSRLYSPRLLGERFWFYFFGYDKFKGVGDESKTWPLVKLLLTFTEMLEIDIRVELDNTTDAEHHDYVGKTDFLTSREEVLVINCRTYPDFFRQLNIKVHIGTGDGNIFLGQYLNYESEGRIISGSILMQRIHEKEVSVSPEVHHIPKLSPDNKMYLTDFQGIDKNILQYLHDKKINFRRTSLRAGHNLTTLEKWLNHHHNKK